MSPLYEVMPRLVPAHRTIEADSPEDAVTEALEDWQTLMADRDNVVVTVLEADWPKS